jgi:hypothetical protein
VVITKGWLQELQIGSRMIRYLMMSELNWLTHWIRLGDEIGSLEPYRLCKLSNQLRHCEERSDEAIQGGARNTGLPRFARNDEVGCVVMERGLLFEVGNEE